MSEIATPRAIDEYSLEQHAGPYASWPLRSRLLHRGRPCGAALTGYVLEAQYRVGERCVLITSMDCPFEESYTIALLDERHRVLGQRRVSWTLLMDVAPEGARLRLRFTDRVLLLSVTPRRTLRGRGTHLRLERRELLEGERWWQRR
ncbi:hypothetical protein [Haliangium ochraceum]|uniref:Uncharacterized protein n=1 Tax=Haliangium ochraceum (strain DSM 14365 / JCM 11303 / SMP-2) TaxID=502025 RepID=D0LH93_HALO1|nr:hypothetical protein [Haliangium ochraceum]ACY18238.1 hypothetical protein Hoch_5761 [Haliangium ochraceum DSM 14365]